MSADLPTNRVAVIGSGPIGLETGLRAVRAGFEVLILEKGRVAESVRSWGHIRLFSPFSMNSSEAGRAAVAASSATLPSDEDLLTGREFYSGYLKPLSELPELRPCIQENTAVLSIGRRWLRKGHSIGQQVRQSDPFELVVECGGEERTEVVNAVLDCSGSYPNHRLIGGGGQGCPGESKLPDECYQLRDIQGSERDTYIGKRTLVVGGGYSAATAIVALGELMQADANTQVSWLTRGDLDVPVHRADGDPLVERDRIAANANLLAAGNVTWIRDRRIAYIINGDCYSVTLESRSGDAAVHQFDNIVAHPGYRPDTSLYRELQVHECYASEGPIKLAAALLGEGSGDCLVQPETGPDTLKNPEPGFFILGAKSYGRNSHFLIQAGLRQIDDVLPLIAEQLEATA